jgi:hypothetical protein
VELVAGIVPGAHCLISGCGEERRLELLNFVTVVTLDAVSCEVLVHSVRNKNSTKDLERPPA